MKEPDWWKLVTGNKNHLAAIVSRFSGELAAKEFIEYVIAEDYEHTGNILQRAWNDAPDAEYIHGITGWGILCDICSDWMFGDWRDE